jgi:hypothetical protein
MNLLFPTVGEYSRLIQKEPESSFKTLKGIRFIPSRLKPITVYLFGSGAYAAVFKAIVNGKTCAIRCFLNFDVSALHRQKLISKRINEVKLNYFASYSFLENEFKFKNNYLPIVCMEWLEGDLINVFVGKNLNNNSVLTALQLKLISLNNTLESHFLAHGDLQCGNILIVGSSESFSIKLIDYDGMFVKDESLKMAIEVGRSEFQHPKRNYAHYNYTIDRFSIWVLITALEAIKYDKALWKEVMQGGFNTLDNFLFTGSDFQNPIQSKLFSKLYSLNVASLNFYINNLIKFCTTNLDLVLKPELFSGSSNLTSSTVADVINVRQSSNTVLVNTGFLIKSNVPNVKVLSSTFKNLGDAPLILNLADYSGKSVIVSNGNQTVRITLDTKKLEYYIEF